MNFILATETFSIAFCSMRDTPPHDLCITTLAERKGIKPEVSESINHGSFSKSKKTEVKKNIFSDT